ncbi:unnamed protein product [Acanthosepion pharaonis]|uniref:Uncharacterized protein n=1 Tax=Acanthosepion pharaonis TaxID=158019 RepID=A0A812E0Z7_ACAPH|nr:unnamed protein product [Sepia pharaonis]
MRQETTAYAELFQYYSLFQPFPRPPTFFIYLFSSRPHSLVVLPVSVLYSLSFPRYFPYEFLVFSFVFPLSYSPVFRFFTFSSCFSRPGKSFSIYVHSFYISFPLFLTHKLCFASLSLFYTLFLSPDIFSLYSFLLFLFFFNPCLLSFLFLFLFKRTFHSLKCFFLSFISLRDALILPLFFLISTLFPSRLFSPHLLLFIIIISL